MRKLVLSIISVFIVSVSIAQERYEIQEGDREVSFDNKNTKGIYGVSLDKGIATCSNDIIEYTISKASSLQTLNINNATSAQALSQYYNAPQAITVHGATFYAYKANLTGGVSLNATVSLYLAGADSMPTGSPLATTTVSVDTTYGAGSLATLKKDVSFTTPVTVSQPYVIVVGNYSANGMMMVCNSWNAGDGDQEWLAGVDLFGTWTNSYDVVVGGGPFDADPLILPHVSYDLTADFTPNRTEFNSVPDTIIFFDNSSLVLRDRMYNRAVFFGVPNLSYTYDFGDGSPTVRGMNTSHIYNLVQNYSVTLSDTILGWNMNCISQETKQITLPTLSDLVITEIMYNGPEAGTDTTEFIEIYNNGSAAVNLMNYTCTGGNYIFPNVSLSAGAYYVIAIDSVAFNNVFGFVPNGQFSSALSNIGEQIVLKDQFGRVIDSVSYADSAPWPAGTAAEEPDGGGASVVLCDANSDNNDGANWKSSKTPTGVIINGFEVFASPGADNVCCANLTGSVTNTICSDDSVVVNGTVYNAANPSGTEVFNNVGIYGCDSTVTINLTVLPAIDNSLTNNSPILTANETGASYRWLDCGNGNAVISGEIAQSFTASSTGSYAVEITVGSCVDTSACENVTVAGVDELSKTGVYVYPNPTNGVITVDFSSTVLLVDYTLMSIDGKTVAQGKFSGTKLMLNLEKEPKGIYFLKVENATINYIQKVFKN